MSPVEKQNPYAMSLPQVFTRLFKLLTFEQQSDVEEWAKQSDYPDEQLANNFVTDNHIFSVTPKMGTLPPHEISQVELKYTHAITGLHRLPVTLKIKNGPPPIGKECLLLFTGVTVRQNEPHVHLKGEDHIFRPVSFACTSPPKQILSLSNKGSAPARFTVELEALQEVRMTNVL
ncbi:hypothetical protein HDU93_003333 [Gonapodya sp. JEL0774]|nr:hypothetical protein HDU93_003333 [Gonapodya sp. JEL0774]